MTPFIHLRTHSNFSCLEGLLSHSGMANLCQKHQMPAVAVTDVKSLAGAMDFSLVLNEAGIQPIIGCTLNFSYEDRDGPMAVLVQNEEGYRNLLWLLRRSKEAIPIRELEVSRVSGLICLTGGSHGFLSNCWNSISTLLELFENRLYVELNRFEEDSLENDFLTIAQDNSIPIVATNDCHFSEPSLYKAHEVLLCIKHARRITDKEREKISEEQYFKSSDEMVKLFEDLPEAIENTKFIAQRCCFMLQQRKPQLPTFDTGAETQDQALYKRGKEGLEKRLQRHNVKDSEKYIKRFEHEFEVIRSMNFAGYFLIVADFVSWAKENGIPVGPGRGSGSASIVSWSLGITDLDPIEFQLIFERFLNPDRVSLPDFDIDFCPRRREEIVDYVGKKYGRDKVGQIITFGRLNTRAVIRDVGRVLGVPFALVEKLAKMIPFQPANPLTLQQGLDKIPLLREVIKQEGLDEMFDIALALEGIPRHESIHAAGIVISDRSLYDDVPILPIGTVIEESEKVSIQKEPEGMPVIQFDMKDVERAGLVKFDFLGLKTLTVMVACESKLRNERNVNVDWHQIPFDDEATYKLMQKGTTTGVFQLESVGIQSLLRRLLPDNLEDIMAVIALFRPGPMQNIPKYVACKHGGDVAESVNPLVGEILKDTYGIIVYQEQVIEIAQKFAGYSASQADVLRRVIGKKKRDEMEFQQESFVKGAMGSNSISEDEAEAVFSLIQRFASYGFNRAHAAGYAVMAYRMCWIKAHHPEVFFSVSMTQDMKDLEKIALFRQDMKSMNVTLLPPHINNSETGFTVKSFDKKEIRFGMGALKGLSPEVTKGLVEEREENGLYKDVFDFVARMIRKSNRPGKMTSKRFIEILACSGALDDLGMTREQICCKSEKVANFGYNILLDMADSSVSDQAGLFDSGSNKEIDYSIFSNERWPAFTKASFEYKTMGMYFCDHPAESIFQNVKGVNSHSDFIKENVLNEGARINATFGVIINKLEHKRWGNRHVLLLTVSDPSATFYIQVDKEKLVKEVMRKMDEQEHNLAVFSAEVFIKEDRQRISVIGIKWYNAEDDTLGNVFKAKNDPSKYPFSKALERNLPDRISSKDTEGKPKNVQNLEELEQVLKDFETNQGILDKSESECTQVRVSLSINLNKS